MSQPENPMPSVVNNSSSNNSNKDALMASLMGGGGGSTATSASGAAAGGGGGCVLLSDNGGNSTASNGTAPLPPAVNNNNNNPLFANDDDNNKGQEILAPTATPTEELPFATAPPPASAPPPPAPAAASLLMQSGLLGSTPATAGAAGGGSSSGGGGGGGLFDDIDQQEAAAEEEERKRKQAAAAAAAAAAEEETRRRQREEEEEKRRQQEEEARRHAQAEQQRLAQQQQQLQDQMQSVYLGGPPNAMIQGGMPNQQQQFTQPQSSSSSMMQSSMRQQQQQQQHPYGSPQRDPQQQQQQQPYGSPQSQQPSYIIGSSQQQQPYGSPQQPPMQAGFYREHAPPAMSQSMPPPQMSSGISQQQSYYGQQQQPPYSSTMMSQSMMGGMPPLQQHQHQQRQNPQPNLMAGMYNANPALGRVPHLPAPTQPPPPPVVYGHVTVDQPLLLSSKSGLFGMGQPPHWSYQISVQVMAPPEQQQQQQQQPAAVWVVRRRFRHVVALENRLHEDCPGSILPPRPDKHATRAIEEASAQQSTEFAVQRAAELQVYLNQLVQHPIVCKSPVLRLFLSLQDDLGAAWPEVSSNALTRLANAGVGAAVKASEATSSTKMPWHKDGIVGGGMPDDSGEDNAELLALYSAESVRMGAVLQAVPKLEGAVTLLREHSEQTGAVGMEVGRLAKEVEATDRELGQPMEIVANGMLRAGRRSKRLALELSAALHTFSQQYKLCRYERMAFSDRKAALARRVKERGRADQRAAHLWQQQQAYGAQQYNYQQGGVPYSQQDLDRMQREAVLSDTYATDAVQECEEIGSRLKSEVNRIAWQRKTEWNQSVKIIASAMKEASTERVAIWEAVRESFFQTFPELNTAIPTQGSGYSQASQQPPVQQQQQQQQQRQQHQQG